MEHKIYEVEKELQQRKDGLDTYGRYASHPRAWLDRILHDLQAREQETPPWTYIIVSGT